MLHTTAHLSKKLSISPRTLERWRVEGFGPPYCKAGRRVLYDDADVEAWLEAGKRHSTSEHPP